MFPRIKIHLPSVIFISLIQISIYAQSPFPYSIELEPVVVPGLPGLHSYAVAQHEGKWLLIGGRLDGIHARQPFRSFPASNNNDNIYVVDVGSGQFWSASLDPLATGIKEHLQSTNMNFIQDEDTLYLIGGYAYSASAQGHITFPDLTSVLISGLIEAIINGSDITPFFKQVSDDVFAITGGQLGKIEDTFYLVGGHRFDGRYNPMGNPTYTQTYSNQIRKFTFDNSGSQLSYQNFETLTDPVHLRRRDYNLLPQIFPDGTQGFTISSGVFQIDEDLPFLYPVDITENGYTPITGFNQYLSNYHSAKVCLYDSMVNEMHSLFFGGISQYYYENGELVQDDLVPFVKTISLLTRRGDGTLHEYQMPVEMPQLQGSSAEFILNRSLAHYDSEIIKLSEIDQDTFLIGHIFGGIYSPYLHPFSINLTDSTIAEPTIYAVRLIRQNTLDLLEIDGHNPYFVRVYPNPASTEAILEYTLPAPDVVQIILSNLQGAIIHQEHLDHRQSGSHRHILPLDPVYSSQTLILTMIFERKFFVTQKIMIK